MNLIRRYIVYGISPILLITVLYMLMSHADTQIGLCIPIIGVSMLIVYMELFILPNPKFRRKFWIGWISIIIGTLCISILGKNQAFHVYYLLAIFMLIRYIEGRLIWYSMGFLMVIMGIGIGTKVIWGHDFFVNWLGCMGVYGIAIAIMLGIKYMIKINQNLEQMQIHLVEKNLELSQAYEQLRRAYDDLEDYTIMKERNYMSREMHDTVGHTLTTSLVELELCKMLIVDQEEVEKRLEHVIEQVRRGLTDLRMTVRKLKEDLDWEQEIYALGERISSYTPIKVRTHIDSLQGIETNTLRCIYRIIQESLTNGIKHGKATAFMIEVMVTKEQIEIEIMDNGEGTIAFKQGFGLNAMTERVEALNGHIEFESYKDEGFTVKASLPKINQQKE